MIIQQTLCDRTNMIIIVRRSTSSSTIFQQCKDRTQSEASNSRVNVGTSEFYHPNLSLLFLCVIASHCLLTFCPSHPQKLCRPFTEMLHTCSIGRMAFQARHGHEAIIQTPPSPPPPSVSYQKQSIRWIRVFLEREGDACTGG